MRRPAAAPRKVVTPFDLKRKVKNLNVRHNVDYDDAGYINLETWKNFHSTQYRIVIRGNVGPFIGSPWMKASELIDHLHRKDWRRVLAVAKGEGRWEPA